MTVERSAAGIVFAVPIEADAFARRATDTVTMEAAGLTCFEGLVAGRRVAWCVGGIGRQQVARATRLLVDGHRPCALVSAGFAGGLTAAFSRGAVVRPAAARGERSDATILSLSGAGQRGAVIVTIDRIVRTPAEKAALAAATGADLVDMETLAVAEVARESLLPCHAVRVISDAAGDELPAEVTRLIQPQSTFRRFGSVIGMLGRRPQTALDLWRLWEHAVVDGRTLAAAIAELIESLPAPSLR